MASSSTIASGDSPRPPIFKLPLELVYLIAKYLSPADCKALRLTCHFFDGPLISPLFRRIFLSKTKLDRDNFFNIAKSPALADAVRELVWYELAEDETAFFEVEVEEDAAKPKTHIAAQPSGNSTSAVNDEDKPIELPPLSTIARDAFWLPSYGSSDEYRRAHPDKCLDKLLSPRRSIEICGFNRRFLSALDAMPNIQTFISCPKPPPRLVCRGLYPLSAGLFQKSLGRLWNTSDGLFHFLLPAMRQSRLNVERLVFTDESLASSLCRLAPSDCLSFSTLTHVDLDIAIGSYRTKTNFSDDIHTCLCAATGLVSLRLRMGKAIEASLIEHSEALSRIFGSGQRQLWPQLREIELNDISLFRGAAVTRLLRLLEAHASTLRRLSYYRCEVTRVLINGMAKITELRSLGSIHVINNLSLPSVQGFELVAYVNGQGPCPEDISRQSGSDWNTGYMIFDPQLMPTAALFDAAGSGRALYSKQNRAEIFEGLHPRDVKVNNNTKRSVYARGKLSKLKQEHEIANSKNTTSVTTKPPRISNWLFKHPNGQEAIGDEPLEFFSDWEDSCDDESSAGEDAGAGNDATVTDDGSDDSRDAGGSDGSISDETEYVEEREALGRLPKRRYRAIPLVKVEAPEDRIA